MNHRFQKLLLGLSLVLFTGLIQAQACDNPKTIRFSVIPKKNAESQAIQYRPLVMVLKDSLKIPVEFVTAPSYGAVVEGLLAGSIDLAELGPASYAQAKARDARITAFASMVQRIGPFTDSGDSYRSLLIVRRDRNFNGLASLHGSSISLIDPASTSGALIPRYVISKLTGEPFERYFGRITFAGSHDRAIQTVKKGFVDAAFVSSNRLDEALRNGSVQPDEIKVIWKSTPIPYDPFVYRGQLCTSVIDKIKQAYFQKNAALQDMFRLLNIDGFKPVSDDQFREIREIYASEP